MWNSDLGSCPSGLFLCSTALLPEDTGTLRRVLWESSHQYKLRWWGLMKNPNTKGPTRRKARQERPPPMKSLWQGGKHHCGTCCYFPPNSSKTISMERFLFSEAITTGTVSIEKSSLMRLSTGEVPFLPSCMKVSDSWAGVINMDYRNPPLPSGIKRQVLSK